jgi:hypothetical protein
MTAKQKPRRPAAELRVYWSKRERALVYDGSKPTGGLLALFLEQVKLIDAYGMRHGLAARIHRPDESDERSLALELDARGYDLTTLRFQIRKKPSAQETDHG